MPRRAVDDDDWDEDEDAYTGEWDEEDDDLEASDDEDDDTIPCPYCRRPIHEDTPRCPYCEQYISQEDAPAARKPWWIIIGALLCLIVFYLWVMYG